MHSILAMKLARHALEPEQASATGLVDEAIDEVERANDELRELARGILPPVLTHGGLDAGVVAETLTNVAKHAHGRRAAVAAAVEDGSCASAGRWSPR